MNLTYIDWTIMIVYFVFVLGIGVALKRFMKTSTDFFMAGRSIPAWICGLAFISANLGAQEVIGMAASGAKYGIATSHFYWIGAIPAMVFVGIFMMPFYYGSRARSVPEYLSLRFDEKTRGLNAISFATMTVFSSGISMYAMAKLIQILHIFDVPFQAMGLPMSAIFHFSIALSAIIVLVYIFLGGLTSAIYNEVLQFFLIVAGFLPLVFLGLKNVGGWHGHQGATAGGIHPLMERDGFGSNQPDGGRMVRVGDGTRICSVVRLLVHGLSGGAAGNGCELDECRATDATDRRTTEDGLPGTGDSSRLDRDYSADASQAQDDGAESSRP